MHFFFYVNVTKNKDRDLKEIIETLIARGIKIDVTIKNYNNALSLIATRNYHHKILGDIIELFF